MTDFAVARYNMVESQIRTNKVTDERVVTAMMTVPREVFVPAASRGIAYVDGAVAVSKGRYMLEPMVFARMLQALEIKATDRALDIGCATGYSTAVLARIAASVVGVDCDGDLAARAGNALTEVGAENAVVVCGGLTAGHPEQGPYDVIMIEGLVGEVPAALTGQLADGGRLVAVVRGEGGVGSVRLYRRSGKSVSSRALFESQPAVLPGCEAVAAFQF